jgi:hypothetical protein
MSTQTNPSRPADGGISSPADATAEPQDKTPQPAADQAQGTAQQAAGQAQEKAQQAAGETQEKAQQAAGQVQDKMRDQLDQRSTQLAEQVHEQASDLRSVSAALRDQGKDKPAETVDRLAGYAEQAGRYLRDKDADAMLGDAEDLGRQKPALVAAAAVALGFAASRFLKASSRKRYSARDAQRLPALPSETPTTSPTVPPTAFEPTPASGAAGTPARSGS